MNFEQLLVTKNSSELESFSMEKLKISLASSGLSSGQISQIIKLLKPQLYSGISSTEIHRKAFSLIKKYNTVYASKYNLKRAIFELGPTGYPFERLIAALLKQKGYKTKVGVVLNGQSITHEIDVLAEKDGNVYAIECKFHSDPKAVSNVKVPLYINSRFLDIQEQWNKHSNHKAHLKQGWLVTNTRFTKDAIAYGKSVGLTLLSWDYPEENGMKTNIDSYGLYPITTLTSLSKKEKQQLIAKDVILVKELLSTPYHLVDVFLDDEKIKQVMEEVKRLCST